MKNKLFPSIFILILVFLFSSGYIYFFELNSINVDSKYMNRPETNTLTMDHIMYFLTTLELYKVHENPLNNNPAFFMLELENSKYYFTVENHEILLTDSIHDIDIRIISSDEILLTLPKKTLPDSFIEDQINKENIKIKALKSEATLAFKGYSILVDKFPKNITAEVVKLSAFNVKNGFHLSTLLAISVLLWMIHKIED